MYSWTYVPEKEQDQLLTSAGDSLDVYVTSAAKRAYWLVRIHQVDEKDLHGEVIAGPKLPLEFRGRKYPDPNRRQVRLVMMRDSVDMYLAKGHFVLPVADFLRIQEFKWDPDKSVRLGVIAGLVWVPVVLIATNPDDFLNIGFPGISFF